MKNTYTIYVIVVCSFFVLRVLGVTLTMLTTKECCSKCAGQHPKVLFTLVCINVWGSARMAPFTIVPTSDAYRASIKLLEDPIKNKKNKNNDVTMELIVFFV